MGEKMKWIDANNKKTTTITITTITANPFNRSIDQWSRSFSHLIYLDYYSYSLVDMIVVQYYYQWIKLFNIVFMNHNNNKATGQMKTNLLYYLKSIQYIY